MDKEKQTSYSVLSVDDDEEMIGLLHEVVSQLGHVSVTAVDGVDAFEKLGESEFDIIITDISMPRMNGIELTKRVKTDFEDIDVVVVTGYQEEYKYTDVIEIGASDFISKPFNINELEAKINRIIRERELRAELKRLSIRDGLTSLYNRRYFDENLKREAIRAFRQRYGLFLLLVDVDNFKEYNDQFGHQKGDDLLKELARLMMFYSRDNVDSVYRYGGDEFAVIIPHAKHEQAILVAQRLRNKFNTSKLGPAFLSMGMAQLAGGLKTLEQDLETLLRIADQHLYLAKNNGGDQICTANQDSHFDNPPLNTSNYQQQ
ncbi:MAG: diguanylate cyclase [Deltaproteobacteria bacterium]|nr:diguanylate cyclase [Deltaproteobacteria bacterium]MDH3802007.1 diguanylate cyclase [Deltaproteobacteria bacterium]MDH3851488.1 diguanylate cyclase [Deltaproteobacteria bacterium]MDH3927794.1 diguanylate cyclase [Deltaproteobacteria bacterium]MDH3949836.1 diguanylate cyclase [Deltaproteobacteria bacterium]